jgi:hypothetical protein
MSRSSSYCIAFEAAFTFSGESVDIGSAMVREVRKTRQCCVVSVEVWRREDRVDVDVVVV